MVEADLQDLVSRARLMNRALLPLQVRKVEVLREWVRDLIDPEDETEDDEDMPTWQRQMQARLKKQKKPPKNSKHSKRLERRSSATIGVWFCCFTCAVRMKKRNFSLSYLSTFLLRVIISPFFLLRSILH